MAIGNTLYVCVSTHIIVDKSANCTIIVDNSDIKVYMMNSRANENLKDEKIKRVFSWPEIYDLISKEDK